MSIIYYQSRGFSMEPFLLDGDELVVETNARLEAGDVALYRSPDHAEPVAHRVVGVDLARRIVVTRPDALPDRRDVVSENAVIGRVAQIKRGAKVFQASAGRVASVWPLASRLKDALARPLIPVASVVQSSALYRRWAGRWARGRVTFARVREGRLVRVVAKLGPRYAGSAELEPRGKSGWVASVGVRARYRGMGIAALLLAELEEAALGEGLHELALEVEPRNRAAARLYSAAGFIATGSRSGPTAMAKRIRRA